MGKGCPDGSEGLAGHRSVEEVFRKCAALIAFAANPLLLAHGVAERGLCDGCCQQGGKKGCPKVGVLVWAARERQTQDE